ncbi:hypothetical protein CG008_00090 [Mesoplasma florum]|nr:hypothetical protein CG008_00090 [Mesoplasma florum]
MGGVGKWMAFFNLENHLWAEDICKKAINENVVLSCKHTNPNDTNFYNSCVICFYINEKDISSHKRVLKFMIENDAIPRKKMENLKIFLLS